MTRRTRPKRPAESGPARSPKILAIASAGGHLVQLSRLMPAWEGCNVAVVTTDDAFRSEIEQKASSCGLNRPKFFVVTEANRWQRLQLIRSALEIVGVLVRFRPDVLVTTGAAPGYLALRLAGIMGARTAWIDSIANADELSLSGRKAGRHADLWLTQWEHLAEPDGPAYGGSVL